MSGALDWFRSPRGVLLRAFFEARGHVPFGVEENVAHHEHRLRCMARLLDVKTRPDEESEPRRAALLEAMLAIVTHGSEVARSPRRVWLEAKIRRGELDEAYAPIQWELDRIAKYQSRDTARCYLEHMHFQLRASTLAAVEEAVRTFVPLASRDAFALACRDAWGLAEVYRGAVMTLSEVLWPELAAIPVGDLEHAGKEASGPRCFGVTELRQGLHSFGALLILEPADLGSIHLDSGKTLGRSDLAGIDPQISRRHCRFERDGATWSVRDLDSANGTRVNGELIADTRELRHGDEIQIGETRLRLEGPPRAAALPLPELATNESLFVSSARELLMLAKPCLTTLGEDARRIVGATLEQQEGGALTAYREALRSLLATLGE